MSWFTRSRLPIKSLYTFVMPEVYYEWEFDGFIPKDTKVYYGDPKRAKALKKMVIAINCDDGVVEKNKSEYRCLDNIPIHNTKFVSGAAKTKSEIVIDYQNLNQRFQNNLEQFKQALASRGYFIDISKKKPTLCNLKILDKNPIVENYGDWEEIIKAAQSKQMEMDSTSKVPRFKAINLTDLHRLTHALTQLQYNTPFDKEKMTIIVKSSGKGPVSKDNANWFDLYILLDARGKKLAGQISNLNNLRWLQVARR